MNLSAKKMYSTCDRRYKCRILISGLISLAVFIALQLASADTSIPYSAEMLQAARIMEQAVAAVGNYYKVSGMEFDDAIDPNHTGLIGPEYSEITTTLGHIEAKRTTTNPNIAALIVHLLEKAGVKAGDTVAIGSSASFPALLIASVAAAEAERVQPVVILSLGASSFGANQAEFNLLHIYDLLLDWGILSTRPAAVSLGGERDVGDDYDPGVRERLLLQIERSAIPLIYEPDLEKNVSARMHIYGVTADAAPPIAAFINTGGSYANLGTSSLVLTVKPGLHTPRALPALRERGVLFAMASHGVPCIHLLFIKGMAISYGLPWDPVPLPKAGETDFTTPHLHSARIFWLTGVFYTLLLLITFLYGWRPRAKVTVGER